MKPDKYLLNHPFWAASDPAKMRLVRISEEFPPSLNPFVSDGVVIQAAGVPGDVPHSKWYVAREGILDGIKRGLIGRKTTVVEATSGNTGNAMAAVCNALGLRFVAVMLGDVPHDKINAIRVLGRRTKVQLLFDSDETTVECARRLGRQDGWYNPDQYSGSWNWESHCRYLAPQLFEKTRISILAVPAGTFGSCMGLRSYYTVINRYSTHIVPVLCAEGQEVPGARTLNSVRKDVKQPWEKLFDERELEFGSRHASFYLSFLTWPYVTQMLGPSFGLAFAGALSFLKKRKKFGTLKRFRNIQDNKIRVVVFGPDDYRPYTSLYLGELKRNELSATVPPSDLLSVLNT